MSEPAWSCSKEDGIYEIEAVAKYGVLKFYVRHWISQIEFDQAINQFALIESAIECMMNKFRKMAFESGPKQEKLGEWPKQKYDTNSITCFKS